MKYHQTIAALGCALLAITLAEAKTITVDNKVGSVAMYTSVQTACDAADPGDTVLIAGSPISYGNLTITKPLHLVGPGYFLNENNIPGITKDDALFGYVDLAAIQLSSPSGSSLTGIFVANQIRIPSGINNVSVDKCFLGIQSFEGHVAVRRSHMVSCTLRASGSSVQNSIIAGSIYSAAELRLENGTTAANCLVASASSFHSMAGTSISSSIFITTGNTTPVSFAANAKGSVTHCLSVGGLGVGGTPTFLPSGNGNNPTIAFTVQAFVQGQTKDKAYVLAPGSPAIGSGLNSVDMGIFGGVLPYVISGVPSIPRITRLQVPSTATSASGLHIEMGAQSF